MITVAEFSTQLDTPVVLEQRSNGKFRVTYGKQVRDNLTYGAAARELGKCVMHSLACNGKLDNDRE